MRLDVVINANENKNAYWVRVQGNDSCSGVSQSAILKYSGSSREMPNAKSNDYLFLKSKSLPVSKYKLNNIDTARASFLWEGGRLGP